MKSTLITLFVIVAIVLGLARYRGEEVFFQGLRSSFTQFLQFMPVMAIAFLVIGFMDVLVPPEVAQRWMSDSSGWRGIAIAWLAGALTPAGGMVGLPLAASLYRAGAGLGVVITYLTSLALLSFLKIPLEIGFYGVRLTSIRLAVCVFIPPLAGLAVQTISSIFRNPL